MGPHVIGPLVTVGSGYTWNRSTCELDPLVTGLLVPLGPLMQGILETPGLTVAGHLVHGQVIVAPILFMSPVPWAFNCLYSTLIY